MNRLNRVSRLELEAALNWCGRSPAPDTPLEALHAAVHEAILDGAIRLDCVDTWSPPMPRPGPGDRALIRTTELTGSGLRYYVDDVVDIAEHRPDGLVVGAVLERRRWHPLQPRAVETLPAPYGLIAYPPGSALIVERIER